MKFIYANELKAQYIVKGHFYLLKIQHLNIPCRSVLEIRQINIKNHSRPNTVIIMMNPGSSLPLINDYKLPIYSRNTLSQIGKKPPLIDANPDNTQYQIMRLMKIMHWPFIRIINLSDIQNGNSQEFRSIFNQASDIDPTHSHSILHPSRKEELLKSLDRMHHGKLIVAWGKNDCLKALAQRFLESNKNIIGIPLNPPWFRFASPYRKDQKIKWLESIKTMMNQAP